MIRKRYKKSEINLNKSKKPPSIKRSIIEFGISLVHEEKVLLTAILTAVFFFCLVLYASTQLSQALQLQQQAKAHRDRLVYEISFWEQVLRVHPDYRDAYFMLAVLKYRFGERIPSKEYLQKAMEIDPNFAQGKKLQQLLEEK
jgi:tetratricopeptide (TPR) repeat protein